MSKVVKTTKKGAIKPAPIFKIKRDVKLKLNDEVFSFSQDQIVELNEDMVFFLKPHLEIINGN